MRVLNGCVVVEWQRSAWSECECSTGRRKVSVSWCWEQHGRGREGALSLWSGEREVGAKGAGLEGSLGSRGGWDRR